jgi:hypothetical protein
VFDLLLCFLYTNELDSEALNLWAKDLFVAADKYLLNSLKSNCEIALSQQVNARNCCELIVLAEDHLAHLLKRNMMDFLRSHQAPLVDETQGWLDLKLSHPQLCFQVFEKLNNVTFQYALPA